MARQVAHDIKNPLTPIQLSAEHLRRVHQDRGTPLSPVLEQCVDTILLQVRMLRQISSEFASFASSPTARPAPTRLPDLVEEVLAGYRIGLPSNVRVEASVPDDLPEVLVDRTLLGRAMINIIENALHAMPAGGVVTRARGRARCGAGCRVSLTDTGVGMDDAALARLFEPYFSTKAAGTGLGLTIAKRNVELMGGRIQVASEKGVGTTVSLDVPGRGCRLDVARTVAHDWLGSDRCRMLGRLAGASRDHTRPIEAGHQVEVGHQHQRPLRVGDDRGNAEGHDHQGTRRTTGIQVEGLEAAIADRADHQRRRHEQQRQGQRGHPAIGQPLRHQEDRRRRHAGRGRDWASRRSTACPGWCWSGC